MPETTAPDVAESGDDRVCILLAMYNGGDALAAQLDSFAGQSHRHWDLLVSDDGSSDASAEVVQAFAARMAGAGHRVTQVPGPRRGFVVNFLSLLARTPDSGARWLALSDQDDVWLAHRLERGLAALAALPDDQPALYCSRTFVTDTDLGNRRGSAQFRRPPGFRNALVQNIAAGNTILLNPAAAALARDTAPAAAAIAGLPAHDWWLYLLITGVGGTVIHDSVPTLLYRQHVHNQIGANDGWRARLTRFSMLFGGRFAKWNSANIAALEPLRPLLTPENRILLDRFTALRRQPLLRRARSFAALGLHRQSPVGQVSLWLALLLGRV